MAGRTIVKPLAKLTPDEYKKIYRLNFRDNGSMQYELTRCKADAVAGNKTDIVMIKDKGTVLAWAMVFPERRRGKRTAYFYTRASHRRRGYGKRLMNKVQQVEPKPWVCPHSHESGAFFKNYKRQIQNPSDDFWLS